MKICSKCKRGKPNGDFFNNKLKFDGKDYYCKLCRKLSFVKFNCIDCNKIIGYTARGLCKSCVNKLRKGKSNKGGWHHTREYKLKMSKMKSGKNSPFWRGGVTDKNLLERTSFRYKEWRKAVFERDEYTCQFCGDNRGGNLNADHIKPFAFFPELRYELSNGRTLCHDCHKLTDTYGEKAKRHSRV